MWTYNQSSELYHHGIKGQKWGIRRFQNEDGSLTTDGKKRYRTYKIGGDRPSTHGKGHKRFVRDSKIALKKYEKATGENIADFNYNLNRAKRLEKKITKKQDKGKNTYRLEKKWKKYSDNAMNAAKAYKKGEAEVNKILGNLISEGHNVTIMKERGKIVTTEAMKYGSWFIGGIGASVLASRNAVYQTNAYKVSKERNYNKTGELFVKERRHG